MYNGGSTSYRMASTKRHNRIPFVTVSARAFQGSSTGNTPEGKDHYRCSLVRRELFGRSISFVQLSICTLLGSQLPFSSSHDVFLTRLAWSAFGKLIFLRPNSLFA